MLSVLIKADFACVAFLLCHYLPINVIYRSCLVIKLIQKRLNISIQQSKMDPFCRPIIAQIFPECTVWHTQFPKFPGEISPDPTAGGGRPPPTPTQKVAPFVVPQMLNTNVHAHITLTGS